MSRRAANSEARNEEPICLSTLPLDCQVQSVRVAYVAMERGSPSARLRQVDVRAMIIHGHARRGRQTAEYFAWHDMKSRCYNRHHPKWSDYGGRGIRVCSRWRQSFSAFLQDMGRRPSRRHTIERKDNEGGYTKANCKWATQRAQQQNRRDTLVLCFRGKKQCATEWARELGLLPDTLLHRLRRGLSMVRVLAPGDLRCR